MARTVFTIGYPEQSEAYKPGADGKKPKYSPTNLAIAPNGDLYVGDGYGSSYINQYNSKGEYLRTFGGKGKEPGRLDCPHGIAVDLRGAEPVLTVADRANNRIQRFTLDGRTSISSPAPTCPAISTYFKNGDVVVPDLGARVTLMDRNNQVITHLGDDSASQVERHPHAYPRPFHARQIRLPARRLLRPRRQYLRSGMGRSRPGHQAAQSVKVRRQSAGRLCSSEGWFRQRV